ncbi:MAG: bifunctional methylenetetrahydrofolate dehydrogenase/methenyltetrahydrofolate cyclohydrolase FolD [Rhodospirillaceae bacterium]|jgi:methylenetetrahydrofolate dehydrogenase (NADP+) / methenyltetrahydrofolate cyclohydrolase|nr:bifunctional methylenetetrahydrofolate dehydrogenase/methenyltetrahydrofolate cyclohydrolase FolD [Rhodospirillaceae bacterium]
MSTDNIIDGKAFAAGLRERVGSEAAQIKQAHGLVPGLAVVLVGDDPASAVYVRNKGEQTREAGMQSFEHRLAADTPEANVLALVAQLNTDDAVHGILVQLPLPDQIDEQKVLSAINPDKDVDGFHVTNVGRLWTGGDALVPCTPYGCILMLKDRLGDLSGKRAIVVGRSNIVGKPMAALLLAESCTVTIAHSRTKDLAQRCRESDIVIAAVGRPEMIKGDWVSPGATVIDVGINRVDAPEKGLKEDGSPKTKLVGDVDFSEAAEVAGAITPVPGGVGPMTIACLLRNTLVAACRQNGIEPPAI